MTSKVFYKKRLVPTEFGLEVITQKFVSIHETPCFHFCVLEHEKGFLFAMKQNDESELSAARRAKILKRISKDCSRFAFDTEEKALKHLRFLKRKQLSHIKRDAVFIEKFLESDELEKVQIYNGFRTQVPNSKGLVNNHFIFD